LKRSWTIILSAILRFGICGEFVYSADVITNVIKRIHDENHNDISLSDVQSLSSTESKTLIIELASVTYALESNGIDRSDLNKTRQDIDQALLLRHFAENEMIMSAYGKIQKILHLLNNIIASIGSFEYSAIEELANDENVLDNANQTTGSVFYAISKIFEENSYIGKTSDEPKQLNENNEVPTLFGSINHILHTIRQAPLRTTNGTLQTLRSQNYENIDNSAECSAADVLFAVTQVGSRGISSNLVTEIASIDNVTNTPTTVLKSSVCWNIVFGNDDESTNPEGPLIAQLQAAGLAQETLNNVALLDVFKTITSKFTEASNENSINVYKLAIPTTANKLVRLDRLNTEIVQSMSTDSTLTIQECLACLLSEVTLDAVKQETLVNTIKQRCSDILLLLLQETPTEQIDPQTPDSDSEQEQPDEINEQCCKDVLSTINEINNAMFVTSHIFSTFASLSEKHIYTVTAELIENITLVKGTFSTLYATSPEDETTIQKLTKLANTINVMNTSLQTILGIDIPLLTQDPEILTTYCDAVATMQPQFVSYLLRIEEAIKQLGTYIEEVDASALVNYTNINEEDFNKLGNFLDVVANLFTNVIIPDSCHDIFQNKCSNFSSFAETIASINSHIDAINTTFTNINYSFHITSINTKLAHIREHQLLADQIKTIDQRIFECMHKLSLFDPQNPKNVLVDIADNIYAQYTPIQVPTIECDPCSFIAGSLIHSLPSSLMYILDTIGNINAYIAYVDPDDEQLSITKLGIMHELLVDIQDTLSIEIPANIHCSFTACLQPDDVNDITTYLQTLILTIQNSTAIGIQRILQIIDHIDTCAQYNTIHKNFLYKLQEASFYLQTLLNKDNIFFVFDTWDANENVMIKILNKFAAACTQYPTISTVIYQNGVDLNAFQVKFNEAVALLGEFVNVSFDIPQSNTRNLWDAIFAEFQVIGNTILLCVPKLQNYYPIPTVATALTDFADSIEHLLDNLREKTICQHTGITFRTNNLEYLESNLRSLSIVFKDCEQHHCHDVAQYITEIYDVLCNFDPHNIENFHNAINNDKIPQNPNNFSNNEAFCTFCMNIIHILKNTDAELPEISHRYGSCGQLLEIIEKLTHIVPHLHTQYQTIVMENDTTVSWEKFQTFTLNLRVIAEQALVKVNPCLACNSTFWRNGNIEQLLSNLICVLTNLIPDFKANNFAKTIVIPLAESVDLIQKAIETLLFSLPSSESLNQFLDTICQHTISNDAINELQFLANNVQLLVLSSQNAEIPTCSCTITDFISELLEFIKQKSQTIINNITYITEQSFEHYQPTLVLTIKTILNMLPHLQETFNNFVQLYVIDNFYEFANNINVAVALLHNWLNKLNQPQCIQPINDALYTVQYTVTNFAGSPNIFVQNGALKDLTTAIVNKNNNISELINKLARCFAPEQEILHSPTPLPATLANTLSAFSILPDAIYAFFHNLGTFPHWIAEFKEFQDDATNLLHIIRQHNISTFCGHQMYCDAISMLKMYPLQELNKRINTAIADAEDALHHCALQNKISDIYVETRTLINKIHVLPIPLNNFDEYLSMLESVCVQPVETNTASHSTSALDFMHAILSLTNNVFAPNTDKTIDTVPLQYINRKIIEIHNDINELLTWFRNIAQNGLWPTTHTHIDLAVFFKSFANMIRKQTLSIERQSYCDTCDYLSYTRDISGDFAAIVALIQLYCEEIAKLCSVCNTCTNLSVPVTALTRTIQAISEQDMPSIINYDVFDSICDILNEIPQRTTALSCINAAEYINSVCTSLAKIVALIANPLQSTENVHIYTENTCETLEVYVSRIVQAIETIVNKFCTLSYMAQAPPKGQWKSIKNFPTTIAFLAKSIFDTLSKIEYCTTCNKIAFSNMLKQTNNQLNSLTTYAYQLNDLWNSYQFNYETIYYIDKLYNFHKLQQHIDAHIRNQKSVNNVVASINAWNTFLSEFTDLEHFDASDIFLAKVNYTWIDILLNHPIKETLESYVQELPQDIHQNISTVFYITEYLDDNTTHLNVQSKEIIAFLKETIGVWENFSKKILQTQHFTDINLFIKVPQTLAQEIMQMISLWEHIIDTLQNKPSQCAQRINNLLLITQNVRNIADSITSTSSIFYDSLQDQIDLIAQILSTIDTYVPNNPVTNNLLPNCNNTEVCISRLNSYLQHIEHTVNHIYHETDWEQTDSQLFAKSKVLALLHTINKCISHIQQIQICDTCNAVARKAYTKSCTNIMSSIVAHLWYIYDKLNAQNVEKTRQLQTIYEFCANLAFYFDTTVKLTVTNATETLLAVTNNLHKNLPYIQNWLLHGDFTQLEESLNTTQSLLPQQTHIISSSTTTQLYYQYIQASIELIHQCLVIARQSSSINTECIESITTFAIYATNLKNVLEQSLQAKQRDVSQLLNALHIITLEGQLWTLPPSPPPSSLEMFAAVQNVDKTVKNLTIIDDGMNNLWPHVLDSQLLDIFAYDASASPIETLLYVTTEFAKLFCASPTELDNIKPQTCTNEAAVVHATQYNFLLACITEKLRSIVAKLEDNYTTAIPDIVREYIKSLHLPNNVIQTCSSQLFNKELEILNDDSTHLVNDIHIVILQIVETLKGKCCTVVSYFCYQFAQEISKIKEFFAKLTTDFLLSTTNDNSAIINALQHITIQPFTTHSIPHELLIEFCTLTNALSQYINEELNTEPHIITMYNCQGKVASILAIQNYVGELCTYVQLLAQNLNSAVFEYNPSAISFLQSFKSLAQQLTLAIPISTDCCEFSYNELSRYLTILTTKFQDVIDTLYNYNCCKDNAGTLLDLLHSLNNAQVEIDQRTNSVIANNTGFSEFFSTVLQFATDMEINSISFNSILGLASIVNKYLTQQHSPAAYSVKACQTLPFVIEQCAYVIQGIYNCFDKILEHWNQHFQEYDEEMHENLITLFKCTSNIKINVQQILYQTQGHFSSCTTCEQPTVTAKIELLNSINENIFANLADYLNERRDQNVIKQQLALLAALQQLNNAVMSCARYPVLQSGSYNITNTTKLNNLLSTWIAGLHDISATNKTTHFINTIIALSNNIIAAHQNIGGAIITNTTLLLTTETEFHETSTISINIMNFIEEICQHFRYLLELYAAQPFSENYLINEAVIATSQFCNQFATTLLNPTYPSIFALTKDVHTQIGLTFLNVSEFCEKFASMPPRCCHNNNIKIVSNIVTEITEELSVLTNTIETNQDFLSSESSEQHIYTFDELAQSIQTVKDVLIQFATVVPDSEILCHDHSPSIAELEIALSNTCQQIKQLNEHNPNTQHESTSKTYADHSDNITAHQQIAVSLSNVLYTIKDDNNNSICNSLAKIRAHTATTLHLPYNSSLASSIQNIYNNIKAIHTTLAIIVSNMREAQCNQFEYVLILNEIEKELEQGLQIIQDVSVNVRKRLWNKYSQAIHTLRVHVDTNTTALQNLASAMQNSSILNAYDAHISYTQFKNEIQKIYDALCDVHVVEFTINDKMNDHQIIEILDAMISYLNNLPNQQLSDSFASIAQIFGSSAINNAYITPTCEYDPFVHIINDLSQIIEKLITQQTIVASITTQTGLGRNSVKKVLLNIANIFQTTPNIVSNFVNIYQATSILSSRFYNNEETPIPNLASTIQTAFANMPTILTTLANLFDVERCDTLIDTYSSQFAMQLQRLEYAMDKINDNIHQNFNLDSLQTICALLKHDIILQINALHKHLHTHHQTLDDDSQYCTAGIVSLYITQIASILSTINDHLLPGDTTTFQAIHITEDGNTREQSLNIVKTQLLRYLSNITNIFPKITSYISVYGPRLETQALDTLKSIGSAFMDISSALIHLNDVMQNMCSQNETNNSQQFITQFAKECEQIYINLTSLTDTLNLFCCNNELEVHFINIIKGLHSLSKQMKSQQFSRNTIDVVTSIVQKIQTPLQSYFTSNIHSTNQLLALHDIAKIFGNDTNDVRIIPFDSFAVECYVKEIVYNIWEIYHAFLEHNVLLKSKTYSQDLQTVSSIDALLNNLEHVVVLFDIGNQNANNSPLHNSALSAAYRTQIQFCLNRMINVLTDTKNAFIKGMAENQVRAELSITKNIFITMPKVMEVALDKIIGTDTEIIARKTAQICSELVVLNIKQINVGECLQKLQQIWLNITEVQPIQSFDEFCNCLSDINKGLYTYMLQILDTAQTTGTITESSNIHTSALLTDIFTGLNCVANTFTEMSRAIKHNVFHANIVSKLIQGDCLIQALIASQKSISLLTNTLTTYTIYECKECALILQSFDNELSRISIASINIADTVTEQAYLNTLKLHKEIFTRVHRISTKIDKVLHNSTLQQAAYFFNKLNRWSAQVNPNLHERIQHLNTLLSMFNNAFSIDDNNELIAQYEPVQNETIEEIQGYIKDEILYIGNVFQAITKMWLNDPYTLNSALIDDISVVVQNFESYETDVSFLVKVLQKFINKLKTPTCCKQQTILLSDIAYNLATINETTTLLSASKHTLTEQQYTNVLDHLLQLSNNIQCIATTLTNIVNIDCLNIEYLNNLSSLADFIHEVKNHLKAMASNFEITVIDTVHIGTIYTCEQIDLIISSLTTYIEKIRDTFYIIINNINPIIWQVAPYRTEIISLFTINLRPALIALSNALKRTEIVAQDMTNCAAHNTVSFNEFVKKISTTVSEITAYPQMMVAQLEQFKYANISEATHTFCINFDKIRILLQHLSKIDWNDEKLALAANSFKAINTNLTKNIKTWTKHNLDAEEIISFLTNLHIDDYVLHIQQIFTDTSEQQPLLTKAIPVLYNENLLVSNIEEMKIITKFIFEGILPQFYDVVVQKHLFNEELSQIFDTLYFLCSSTIEIDESSTQSTTNAILRSIQPPQSYIFNRVSFVLSHKTCCEPYTELLERAIAIYEQTKINLHKMASATVSRITNENIMAKVDHISNMSAELNNLATTLNEMHALTQTLILYMETSQNNTCFSIVNVGLLDTLSAIINKMENVNAHTIQIFRMHCALNDLSETAQTTTFFDFENHLKQINTYYDESIAIAWNSVNDVLYTQYLAFETIKTITRQNSLCFLRGMSFSEQLNSFDDFNKLIKCSIEALRVYKQRHLVKTASHLYRIYKNLEPLSAIQSILFRNLTLSDANMCLVCINKQINNIASLITEINAHHIESVVHINNLCLIESYLQNATHALRTYTTQHNAYTINVVLDNDKVFETSDFIYYVDAIVRYMTDTLPKVLIGWHSTLQQENGTQDNERCYTDIVQQTSTTISNLMNICASFITNFDAIFDNSINTVQNNTLSKDTLLSAFSNLYTGVTQINNTLLKIQRLIEDPTCCYHRKLAHIEICTELDLISRAITGATQCLTKEPFSSLDDFVPLIDNLQHGTHALKTLSILLEDIQPRADLACQAQLITKQTESIICPVIRQLREVISRILGSIGTIQTSSYDLDIVSSNACQSIPLINEKITTIQDRINTTLTEFNERLACIDLFTYSEDFVNVLKQFFASLQTANVRLAKFCYSVDGQSCNVCHEVTHENLLSKLVNTLQLFENTIRIIENNSNKYKAKMFHVLVNATDIFELHMSALLAVKLNDTDQQKIHELKHAIEYIAESFQKMMTIPDIADYEQCTIIMQQITSCVENLTKSFQIDVELPVHIMPTYNKKLMYMDNNRLLDACKRITNAFYASPISSVHLAIMPSWKRLAIITHELSWKFREAFPRISENILVIFYAQEDFISKVSKFYYCQQTNVIFQTFVHLIKNLTNAFYISKTDFIKNLLPEESHIFVEKLSTAAIQIRVLSSNIETLSIPIKTSPYVCSMDMQSSQTLLKQLDCLKDAVIHILAIFTPSLSTMQCDDSEVHAEKTVIVRNIVESLRLLQQEIYAALMEATHCPVRDYNRDAINAVKILLNNIDELFNHIPTIFKFTNICRFCNEVEILLTLNEIPSILQNIREDVAMVITYMEQTCCSRLAYNIYETADLTNIIWQNVAFLSDKDTDSIENFITNDEIQVFANSIIAILNEQDLTLWSKLNTLFANTDSDHCSAERMNDFLYKWNDVIRMISNILAKQLQTNFVTTIIHPEIYNCSTIQRGVQYCIIMLQNIANAIMLINQKLENSIFLYSTVFSLNKLLLQLRNTAHDFTTLQIDQVSNGFCIHCVETSIFTDLINKKNESNTTIIDTLVTNITTLTSILTKYCNYEFAENLHRFSFNVSLLSKVFEDISQQLPEFWSTKLNDTIANTNLRKINDIYSKDEGINYYLHNSFLEDQSSQDDTYVCHMTYVSQQMNYFNKNLSDVVKLFAELSMLQPLWFETNNTLYIQLEITNDFSVIVNQWHDINSHLTSISDCLNVTLTKIRDNWLTIGVEISSSFTDISTSIKDQAQIFRQIYAFLKQKTPCTLWKDCSVCETCENCEITHLKSCSCSIETSARYNIWQIFCRLDSIAETINTISQAVSPDCCVNVFKYLFLAPAQIRTIMYDVYDCFQWENVLSENNLARFVECLTTNLEVVNIALQDVVIHRNIARQYATNCRIALLEDQFRVLSDAIYTFGNNTSSFIATYNIPLKQSRQKIEDFVLTCRALSYALTPIPEQIARIVEQFDDLAEKIESSAIVNKNIIGVLNNFNDKLSTSAGIVDSLIIPDEIRQMCNNCDKNILNNVLTDIRDTLNALMISVNNVKNAFFAKYCCENVGVVVSETDKIIACISENVVAITMYRFTSEEICQNPYLPNCETITLSIHKLNQQLVKILSVRSSIPAATEFTFCLMSILLPTIEELNIVLKDSVLCALQKFVETLGQQSTKYDETHSIETSMCTSFDKRLQSILNSLQRISTGVCNIFTNIRELTIDNTPHSSCKNLIQALSQTSSHLYEWYMNMLEKAVCINCDFFQEMRSIYFEQNHILYQIANIDSYLISKHHMDIATTVYKALQAYKNFTVLLDFLHLVEFVHLANNDPYFGNVINEWNSTFAALIALIPVINTLKVNNKILPTFLAKLNETTDIINQMNNVTYRFLENITDITPTCIESTDIAMSMDASNYIQSAISLFNEYTANAAESMQWFGEHCAFVNGCITNENTFASIVEFANKVDQFKAFEAICNISSITYFYNTVDKLKNILAPRNIEAIIAVTNITESFNKSALALQTATLNAQDIVDEYSYTANVARFFSCFTDFAIWSRHIVLNDLRTLQTPLADQIFQLTLDICKNLGVHTMHELSEDIFIANTNGNIDHVLNVLAVSLQTFTGEVFSFINMVSNIHKTHRVELDLNGVINTPIAILIIKNNITALTQHKAIIHSLDVVHHMFIDIVSILKLTQSIVRTLKLQDTLNSLTNLPNGTSALDRLFAPVRDSNEMPLPISAIDTVISVSNVIFENAQQLHKAIFGT
jgi:hypothetical protein